MNNLIKNLREKPGLLPGVFIGLALGLCIAIIVALVVTKTASKVTSKHNGVCKSVAQDSSAPLPDPNKPLYAQTESGIDATAKAAKPASSGPKNTVNTYRKPASSNAKDAKSRREWRYYLQAGAYLNEGEAENARAQLAFMGLEAYISEKWSSRGTLHRVRVGPFANADVMNQVRRRLMQNGLNPSVVRLQVKNGKKR